MSKLTSWKGEEITLQSVKDCVGPGWSDIIDRLVTDLFALGWDGSVHQVKEKFGGLRFYIGEGSDEVYGRICIAENESFKTCEDCGAPGCLWSDGWIRCLCPECATKFGQKSGREMKEFRWKRQ